MKRLFLLLFTLPLLSLPFISHAQEGYHIKIQVPDFKDTTAIMAYHFGEQKLIHDTLDINSEGIVELKGEEKIPGGLYILLLPTRDYFEFILADDQHFSMKTSGAELINNMEIEGSAENELFYKDMLFLDTQRKAYGKLAERMKQVEDNPDSVAALTAQMESIDHAVRSFRTELAENNPDLFYTKFLKTLEEPEVPEMPVDEEGNVDSTYPYRYYKRQYLENVDFSDERLLRTPVMEQKVKTYIDQLTVKHPDSLIIAVDHLIGKAQANKEVFKYVAAFLLNKYAKREVMGLDAVYVHIAEKYYLSGLADWVPQDQLDRISRDANRMKPLLIGKQAPNVTAKDMEGNKRSLYDLDSDYTIVWFWDSDCGHCQKETPKLHKRYVEEWKDKGVKVFAVSVEYTEQKWRNFIAEKDLTQWINVIDAEGQGQWRLVYDISSTPKVFILDKDKKIIGKRLDVSQIGDFLDFEMNKKKGS